MRCNPNKLLQPPQLEAGLQIRVNDASVLASFEELIPRAAALGEDYLRAVARGVQEYEPPVVMELGEMVGASRGQGPKSADVSG